MPPFESAGRKPLRLAQAGPSFVRSDSSGIPLSGMSQSARAAPGTAATPAASTPPSAKARIVRPADHIGRMSGLFIFSAPQTRQSFSSRFGRSSPAPYSPACFRRWRYVITSPYRRGILIFGPATALLTFISLSSLCLFRPHRVTFGHKKYDPFMPIAGSPRVPRPPTCSPR